MSVGQSLGHSEERFRAVVEGIRDYAIFLLDPAGVVISWNSGAEKMKGYRAEEIIGQHFSCFYSAAAIAAGWPHHELKKAMSEGRFEDEGWRVRKDGSTFWANVVITALHDEDGHLRGFVKITRDLSDRRRHEESLRQSEERFRLLVQGVKDYAILMLDPDGLVVSWNSGAENIMGYQAAEIIGSHFSRFYTEEANARGWPHFELAVAKREGRFEDEGWRVRKDGSTFWANVVIAVLHDRDGRLRGFAKVTKDMTERKRLEALEVSDRRMNEFIAMLAHELRNPLAPIRNAVGMLMMEQLTPSTLKWSTEVIDRQLTHLTRLVDDLLDVSRITSGKISSRKDATDLAIVVAHAVEASRPSMDCRGHILEFGLPTQAMWIEGDPTRLTQVVLNLLNNSAKFTPAGGRINLTLEKEEDMAVLRVRDTGIGISGDFLPRVFEPFTQGENSLDRSEGGLGIGLTLVRGIIEMHGGTVVARSDGPGRGTEIVVYLPLVTGQPFHKDHADPTGEERAHQPGSRRILVVDDYRDSAETLASLLRMWGHKVRSAHDARTAILLARQDPPDIVLLDIGLPGMNGYEAAERLRRLPNLEGVVLVAMTGYNQAEDRRRIVEAGFDVHLVKPVDHGALRQLIESAAASPPRAPEATASALGSGSASAGQVLLG